MATDRFESQETQDDIDGMIKIKNYSHSYTISANGSVAWSPVDDGVGLSGYQALGVVEFSTNNANVVPAHIGLSNGAYSFLIRNIGTTSITGNFIYKVLFVQDTNSIT